MIKAIARRVYNLLGILEKTHGFDVFDGLHRQILNVILKAELDEKSISPTDVVELGLTSRSSTYRKINDLKRKGFIALEWKDEYCYLRIGPQCDELFRSVDERIKDI